MNERARKRKVCFWCGFNVKALRFPRQRNWRRTCECAPCSHPTSDFCKSRNYWVSGYLHITFYVCMYVLTSWQTDPLASGYSWCRVARLKSVKTDNTNMHSYNRTTRTPAHIATNHHTAPSANARGTGYGTGYGTAGGPGHGAPGVATNHHTAPSANARGTGYGTAGGPGHGAPGASRYTLSRPSTETDGARIQCG